MRDGYTAITHKNQKKRNQQEQKGDPAMKLLKLLLLILGLLQFHQVGSWVIQSPKSPPAPSPWPERFHALLYMNLSTGHLQITNLWYDWPKGRNVNIMQKQLGELVYDVEWDNGTSFYYTLGGNGACRTMYFEVGIPRRDFLDGANYLGRKYTDGFLCNVWEKVDFIWYYEDVITKFPVRWDFYDGISTHVITYEVGMVLEDSEVQAPVYCFQDGKEFLGKAFEPLTRDELLASHLKESRLGSSLSVPSTNGFVGVGAASREKA